MGSVTSTDINDASSPSPAETLARTCSDARLPLSSACASGAPPISVTVSTASAPWNDIVVTATPLLLAKSGISAAMPPELSVRASTAVAVAPAASPCSARRLLDTSRQSGEAAWHAASRRDA
jgi:hypothetical protein